MGVDETDRAILNLLQADARTTITDIADAVDMSPSTVHTRIDRLKESGILEGTHAKINLEAAGYDGQALVGLRVEQGQTDDVRAALKKSPFVRQIWLVTGTLDVIVRVLASDTEEFRESVMKAVGDIEGLHRSHSMIILASRKENEPTLLGSRLLVR